MDMIILYAFCGAKCISCHIIPMSYANELIALSVLTHNLFISFKLPKLSYIGASDPKDHLAHYNNHMNILKAFDIVKCKAFSMTLSSTP